MSKKQLIFNIDKELNDLKNNCEVCNEEIIDQDYKIKKFNSNIGNISHKLDISKWHIDNVTVVFSKVFNKFSKKPIVETRINSKHSEAENNFKNTLNNDNILSENNEDKSDEYSNINDKLDEIFNIANQTNYLIKKQNLELQNLHDEVEEQTNKVSNNSLKIKNILKK